MGDFLEEYIVNNRSDFDDLNPGDELWQRINKQVAPKQKRDLSWLWKVVAILFLGSTIALVVERQFSSDSSMYKEVLEREFAEAESFYFHQISEKKKLLNELDVERKNKDLLLEERYLDQYYQKLKKEYLGKPNEDRVKDAMIQNLRMRIQILNDQIKILGESNNPSSYEKEIEI